MAVGHGPGGKPRADLSAGTSGAPVERARPVDAPVGTSRKASFGSHGGGAGRTRAGVRTRSEAPLVRVHLRPADLDAEDARVKALARAAGGRIEPAEVPRLAATEATDEGVCDDEAPREQRIRVRVPAGNAREFLARVERLVPATVPPVDAPTGTAPGRGAQTATAPPAPQDVAGEATQTGSGWSVVEIVLESPVAVAGPPESGETREKAPASSGDEPRPALARMEKLLEGARKKDEAKEPLTGARVDTMMRVEIAAFRGDVAAELHRVKRLAPHYGGSTVWQNPAEVPGAPPPAMGERATLRLRVDARRVTQFVEAVRLGTHPPRSGSRTASSRGSRKSRDAEVVGPMQAAEQPRREFVTVEVTIRRTPAPRPRR
jgi:hypothetical protein